MYFCNKFITFNTEIIKPHFTIWSVPFTLKEVNPLNKYSETSHKNIFIFLGISIILTRQMRQP